MGADEPRWVSRIVVEAVHLDQVREHGGLLGLRDTDALESALARPINKLAYKPNSDLATFAAAYAFGMIRNHPFQDGNKRIGLLTAVVFLGLNGMTFAADDADIVTVILGVAAGTYTERRLANWFRRNCRSAPGD